MKEFWNTSEKVTEGLINKLDNDRNVFYRFQDKSFDIDADHSESWGMIYSTRQDAIEDYMSDYDCDEEEAEENAILPGKSCMTTLQEIWKWSGEFDSKNFVLLAFYGTDTYAEGHDGEYVAEFNEAAAIFDIDDVYGYLFGEVAA